MLADGVPTYCICQVKGDDGRQMIQCANGERWCLKEWYHLDCIGMAKEYVPPGDWYCDECVKARIGNLKKITYVPWKCDEPKSKGVHLPRKKTGKKKVEQLKRAEAAAAATKVKENAEKATDDLRTVVVEKNKDDGYDDMVFAATLSRPNPQRELSPGM